MIYQAFPVQLEILSDDVHRQIAAFTDAEIGFDEDHYSVGEETGAVNVCIDSGVTQGFQADLTVYLSVFDGTASKSLQTSKLCVMIQTDSTSNSCER